MSDNDRYQIYCNECEEDVFLISLGDDTFRCPICSNLYSSEDRVIDIIEARDYYLQYRGAVTAGLIPDPDFAEYDKEHPNEFR